MSFKSAIKLKRKHDRIDHFSSTKRNHQDPPHRSRQFAHTSLNSSRRQEEHDLSGGKFKQVINKRQPKVFPKSLPSEHSNINNNKFIADKSNSQFADRKQQRNFINPKSSRLLGNNRNSTTYNLKNQPQNKVTTSIQQNNPDLTHHDQKNHQRKNQNLVGKQRIQKILSHLGYGSRRNLEELIAQGQVTINGKVAQLGDSLSSNDRNLEIKINGQHVNLHKEIKCRIIAYNKREGEASTNNDQLNRSTVFNRLPRIDSGRWIQVGRLDINTSGLLLFTTDGELAHRLMHPSYQITRGYLCRIYGDVTTTMLFNLTNGVELEDGTAKFDNLQRVAGGFGANNYFLVTLHSGKNHEVKRLWESQGVVVSRLTRVSYADYELARGIPIGGWVELEPAEVNAIRKKVQLPSIEFKSYNKQIISRSEEKRQQHIKMRKIRNAIKKDLVHNPDPQAKLLDRMNNKKNSQRRTLVEKVRQSRRDSFITNTDFN